MMYFDAKPNIKYQNRTTGLESYFLSFPDSDMKLEIMYRPSVVQKIESNLHLGYIHMAFSVGSRAKVEYITQLLENDGYTVVSRPRITGDGFFESCVLDPDGNQIEITV